MPGTWSYDPTDLATSAKDTIRLEIGDTDSNNWLLSDEEINYALSKERNFWAAAARCAEMAASALLRKADPKLGRSMQVIYSKAAEQYWNRARMLRCKAMGTVSPYIGGMEIADKESISGDTSLVAPSFTRTMMENPWVGGYTTDSVDPVSGGDDPADFGLKMSQPATSLPGDMHAFIVLTTCTWEAYQGFDGHAEPSYAAPKTKTCYREAHSLLETGLEIKRLAEITTLYPDFRLYFDGDDADARTFQMYDRFSTTPVGETAAITMQPTSINTTLGPWGTYPWLVVVTF